jgi:hypothetical protein
MSDEKDQVSPERKEELKDEMAKRVADGKSAAVSNLDTVFGSDAENMVRTETFEQLQEEERDIANQNKLKQQNH